MTAISVVDNAGDRLGGVSAPAVPEQITVLVRRHAGDDARVGIETGAMSHRLVHELRNLGLKKSFVSMPEHARGHLLKMQINNTDKNDAEGLAQIVRTGWWRSGKPFRWSEHAEEPTDFIVPLKFIPSKLRMEWLPPGEGTGAARVGLDGVIVCSSLWTLQHLCFGPDVGGDLFRPPEKHNRGGDRKIIDKGDAIRERPRLARTSQDAPTFKASAMQAWREVVAAHDFSCETRRTRIKLSTT